MNRRYFGDCRDLFKFDLIKHLLKSFPSIENITFIPMLTEWREIPGKKGSNRKDLNKAIKNGRPGSKNPELIAHLQRLQEIEDDLEYFQGIHSYFKKENIIIDTIHDQQFSHKHRKKYFEEIFKKFPKKSLVFIDPDIGLEGRKPTQRHLMFDEVKKVYERMDNHSVLMIYQHIPRKPRSDYIKKRCTELSDITACWPETITDNEIVFFIFAKNPEIKTRLCAVLGEYATSYTVVCSGDFS